MRGAVVFDDEALLRVVEVGSTGERPVLAMKGNLRLGAEAGRRSAGANGVLPIDAIVAARRRHDNPAC
jgi:hypothetical protein